MFLTIKQVFIILFIKTVIIFCFTNCSISYNGGNLYNPNNNSFNFSHQINYWNPYYGPNNSWNKTSWNSVIKRFNTSGNLYNPRFLDQEENLAVSVDKTNVRNYPNNNNNNNNNYCLPNYYNCSGSHNLYAGCVRNWDRLLYNRRIYKQGRWWSSREKIITFPEYGPGHLYRETITGIRIYDRYCNNQGGYASITSGGVGYKNVTIRLYSTGWGKGFDFLVQIFGS